MARPLRIEIANGLYHVTARGWRIHALETGKSQAGEARFSRLAEQISNDLGIDVDLSIIRRGGQFDNGAQTPLSFGF